MILFLFWGMLAICITIIAHHKGRNAFGWLLYGFFLWPIALVHILCVSKTSDFIEQELILKGNKKCVFCAEFIKEEAKICKHCQKEVPPPVIVTTDNTKVEKSLTQKRRENLIVICVGVIFTILFLTLIKIAIG